MGNQNQSQESKKSIFVNKQIIIDKQRGHSMRIRMLKQMNQNMEGLSLWQGGIVLSRYILANSQMFSHKKVLQLGSGVGIGAISISKLTGCSDITLSDCDQLVIENSKTNCAQNSASHLIKTKIINWQSHQPIIEQKYDIIIGSQLESEEINFNQLIRFAKLFLEANGLIVLILCERKQHPDDILVNLSINNMVYSMGKLGSRLVTNVQLEVYRKNKKNLWVRSNLIGFNSHFITDMNLPMLYISANCNAVNHPFQQIESIINHIKCFVSKPNSITSNYSQNYSNQVIQYSEESLLKIFKADQKQFMVIAADGGSLQKIIHCFVKIRENVNNKLSIKKLNLTVYQSFNEKNQNSQKWREFFKDVRTLEITDNFTTDIRECFKQIKNCNSTIIIISFLSNQKLGQSNLKNMNKIVKNLRENLKKSKIFFIINQQCQLIDIALNSQQYSQVDFLLLNPSNNLGGTQTCEIIIARKNIFDNLLNFIVPHKDQENIKLFDFFKKQIINENSCIRFYRAALSFQVAYLQIGYLFMHERSKRNIAYLQNLIKQKNKKIPKTQIKLYKHQVTQPHKQNNNKLLFNFQTSQNKLIQQNFITHLYSDLFGIQVSCIQQEQDTLVLHLHSEKEITNKDKNQFSYVQFVIPFYCQHYQIQYLVEASFLIAQYWCNIKPLYLNHGQQENQRGFKFYSSNNKSKDVNFSFSEIYKRIQKQQVNDSEMEGNRREILLAQIERGKIILENPFNFFHQSNQ